MDRDVKSESDLEIVHRDGTVTSKVDNVRRNYADHVAIVASQAAPQLNVTPPPPSESVSTPPFPTSTFPWKVVAVTAGISTVLATTVSHFLK